jgi:hypothetical protein
MQETMELRQLYNNKVRREMEGKERKEVVYVEGQLVWALLERDEGKLQKPWRGPYQVMRKKSKEVLEVQMRGEPYIHTLHVSRVKPYTERFVDDEFITEQPLAVRREAQAPEAQKAIGEFAVKGAREKEIEVDTWEVEEITRHKIDRHGNLQFEVKWKGYPKSENTWEPEHHLVEAKEALKDYFTSIGGDREELQIRLAALLKETVRNRRLPLTQLKWKIRDLVGRSSRFNINKRVKEGLQRDIGEITSFPKARDLLEGILENFDTWYPPSRRSSKG